MRTKFEVFYRGLLVLLAMGLFWAVWGPALGAESAATNPVASGTNAVASGTNAVAATAPATATNAAPFRLIDRERLTMGLDRIPFLRNRRMFGIPLWQYISSFLFLFAAFYASKALDFLARVWLRKWAERARNPAGDLLLELASGPIKVVAFVILLHVGLSVFDWPAHVERWLSNGLKVIVAVSMTYAILKVVDLGVGAWGKRGGREDEENFNRQLGPIVRKATKVLVVVVAGLVTLDNVGVNITGLVASLSIGGLALGLAAQDTVGNLFGAVAVLVDKPFKVGDRVQFDAVDGVVEVIGLRSTRIRNLDGHLITVPNKTMGNATITNITRRPTIRTVMKIGVTYGTPPEKVARASALLREIFGSHPRTKEVTVAFRDFADFSLVIHVIHIWDGTEFPAYLAAMEALNLEVLRRFASEGIEFAFPTQTLHVRTA